MAFQAPTRPELAQAPTLEDITSSSKQFGESLYTPELMQDKLKQAAFDRAQQSALNLEAIQNARSEREKSRAMLDLEKKKMAIAIEEAEMKGGLSNLARKQLEEQFNAQHGEKKKLLDAQDLIAEHAEHQLSQDLRGSVGMLSALAKAQQGQAQPLAMAPRPVAQPPMPSIPQAGAVAEEEYPRYEVDMTKALQGEPAINESSLWKKQQEKKIDGDGKAVPITEAEIESKAQAILDGRLAPSQLPKFGGAASIFNKVTAKVFEKDPQFSLTAAEQNYASTKTALNQMLKTSSLIRSFEATAYKNANVLEHLTQKLDWRGKSPILNKLKQAWNMRVVQDPATAAAKTSLVTFTTEYAKIMSGQTGGAAVSDSARKEASDLIELTDNPEAFANRISVMKQDMMNRKSGLDEEIASLQGKKVERTTGTEELVLDEKNRAFIQKAKAAGYSDEEIQEYLSKRK